MANFKRNLSIGFGLSLLILILSTVASYICIHNLLESSRMVSQTNKIISSLESVISTLKDAETGQRGYLLTGEGEFLEPYQGASELALKNLESVKELTKDNPQQQEDCIRLKEHVSKRMSQLQYLIDLKKANQLISMAEFRKGKTFMDEARKMVKIMEDREQGLLVARTARMNRYIGYAPFFIVTAALLALLITVIFYLRVKKDFKERESLQRALEEKDRDTSRRIDIIQDIADRISVGNYAIRVNDDVKDGLGGLAESLNKMAASLQYSFGLLSDKEWLQAGIAGLNEKMLGEKDITTLSDTIIEYVANYTRSQVGALYLLNSDNVLKLHGCFALVRHTSRDEIKMGEGLIGQSALSGKEIIIREIQEDTVSISFATGELKPKNVIVIPICFESTIKGIMELASLNEFTENDLSFLNAVSKTTGVVINSAQNRFKLQELLEETRSQSEELQARHSEMEHLNSELETQTQLLQSSEEELRVQHEELMQANQELEERTRLVEEKNHLILERNLEIQAKAEELALSTKYKSEFLANMSHELRTPLNSILLLSGLLADNNEKNLTNDQVEFARVIQTSGHGLLSLIDEILDLSKIESGKMELEYDRVAVSDIVSAMRSLFIPVANQKKIEFKTQVATEVPEMIETDRMRLEQVLKNLLSNALKFTSTGGSVSLSVYQLPSDDSRIAIAVRDTGIGIPREKQQLIFEAFQQADGSTRRKFGGTGLGLSISRELVKLLGGEIHLNSELDKGSEFIIYIPVSKPTIDENSVNGEGTWEIKKDKAEENGKQALKENLFYTTATIPENIPDDRNDIKANDKIILIIEDDTAFAKILLDFTRKNGYKGIVSVRGDEGVDYAKRYKPLGILLDIELPVRNGWEVMKDLKADPQTRHIPVHIMSSHELEKENLKGAVDFINKPVALEKVKGIFEKIDYYLTRNPKKVLIVEENAKHAKALAYYLENFQVAAEIKNNVKDGVDALLKKEVDCVILDLGVRHPQSHEELEEVKKTPGLEHLPIIILTGKTLSKAEEQRIKKYADSIVLKAAHSYQRILDEISLFLHIVEENRQQDKFPAQYKKLGALDEVLKGKTVLVADDDIRNIFSITKALENYNMNVLSAMDGKEALVQLKETPVDIILMDMMMPELDGYETTVEIRKDPETKSIPIIAVTAKAMAGDREKCINAGASDYITKPVDIDQLLSLLRVWLYEKVV